MRSYFDVWSNLQLLFTQQLQTTERVFPFAYHKLITIDL